MNFFHVSIQGWAVEPRSAGIYLHLCEALERAGLALFPQIDYRVMRRGGALQLNLEPPNGGERTWRLTDWGQLTLIEVIRLAEYPGWSPVMKRRAIEDALAFAGYPEVA
jgi:hypothetical protein